MPKGATVKELCLLFHGHDVGSHFHLWPFNAVYSILAIALALAWNRQSCCVYKESRRRKLAQPVSCCSKMSWLNKWACPIDRQQCTEHPQVFIFTLAFREGSWSTDAGVEQFIWSLHGVSTTRYTNLPCKYLHTLYSTQGVKPNECRVQPTTRCQNKQCYLIQALGTVLAATLPTGYSYRHTLVINTR